MGASIELILNKTLLHICIYSMHIRHKRRRTLRLDMNRMVKIANAAEQFGQYV